MNWRQRQKEEYSFYVTGVTVVVALIVVIYAVVKQLFFLNQNNMENYPKWVNNLVYFLAGIGFYGVLLNFL